MAFSGPLKQPVLYVYIILIGPTDPNVFWLNIDCKDRP